MLVAPTSILRASCGAVFELSGDKPKCPVLTAFQLVQSGWGQPGLPSWGSVVDHAEVKGTIDLGELVFSPAPPFGGEASTRHLLEALETTSAICSPKERAPPMVTPRNFDSEVVLRGCLFSYIEGGQPASFELLVKLFALDGLLRIRGLISVTD